MSEHDIMTVEEVASYLRVSERTVYDWAKRAEIPCGRLGTTWRFKRSVIEEWVDRKLAHSSTLAPADTPLDSAIGQALAPDRVVLLDVNRKEEAFLRLIDRLATARGLKDRDVLTAELFRREGLMGTAVGMGIGVPHVRLASVTDMVMAVGVSSRDIGDYVSLDGVPVRIICMFVGGLGQHAEYLHLLSAVMTRLRDENRRRSILAAKDPREVHLILTQDLTAPDRPVPGGEGASPLLEKTP